MGRLDFYWPFVPEEPTAWRAPAAGDLARGRNTLSTYCLIPRERRYAPLGGGFDRCVGAPRLELTPPVRSPAQGRPFQLGIAAGLGRLLIGLGASPLAGGGPNELPPTYVG